MLQVVALGEVAGIDLLPLFRVPRLHFHLLLVPLPMVGVWPPLSGEIRFDGAALADYERRALGASIGYLPQDVELFDGTVADNIARFGDADGARTRRGTTCQSPAMLNGRCRIHGGRSPGAPRGERNGRWRGGFYTPEAQADRRRLRELIRQMRETMDELP